MNTEFVVAKFFVSKNTFACSAVFRRLSDKLKKKGPVKGPHSSIRDLFGEIYCSLYALLAVKL